VALASPFKAINHKPGHDTFTSNTYGQTIIAEGWLTNHLAPRHPTDQNAVAGDLPGYHAGHLIPARFGGPGDKRNLVPMPEVINTSYVKSVENAIARHTVHGLVYLKVSVVYRGNHAIPSWVKHECFRRSPSGQLQKIAGGECITSVPDIPSKPMGGMTDPYSGRNLTPKEFPDPKGTRGRGPHGPP
jgi:hypothetical protein